jgi:molybdate transport system substrate-binding protein
MMRRVWLACASLAAGLAAPAAHAAEIRMLSAGAVEIGLRPALAEFERSSGHVVRVSYAAAPQIVRVLAADPLVDVVIAPPAVLDALARAGALGTERVTIGKVGIGVAVRPGAVAPDITSVETLKQELLSADSVVFNRASTGLYIETMLKTLGIADAVDAKATRLDDGASVMRRLLAGSATHEFGFGAMTEIVPFAGQGLKLVGPLPAALQNYTTYVAAPLARALAPGAPSGTAVAALLLQLQGSQARAAFANAGIEPTH